MGLIPYKIMHEILLYIHRISHLIAFALPLTLFQSKPLLIQAAVKYHLSYKRNFYL